MESVRNFPSPDINGSRGRHSRAIFVSVPLSSKSHDHILQKAFHNLTLHHLQLTQGTYLHLQRRFTMLHLRLAGDSNSTFTAIAQNLPLLPSIDASSVNGLSLRSAFRHMR